MLLSLFQSACAPMIITAPTASADRRSFEQQFIDQRIEWSASIEAQEIVGSFRVDFVSFNKKVLVVGQAASQEIIEKITQKLKSIENIGQVYNRMTIGEKISYKARANDSVITVNIISRVLSKEKEGSLSPLHLKVLTEDRIVYLMGLLSEEEAEQAENIAQTSRGVKKVVSLIEIQNLKK